MSFAKEGARDERPEKQNEFIRNRLRRSKIFEYAGEVVYDTGQ